MKNWKFEVHYHDNYVISVAYGHPNEIIEEHKEYIAQFEEACNSFDLGQYEVAPFNYIGIEDLVEDSK